MHSLELVHVAERNLTERHADHVPGVTQLVEDRLVRGPVVHPVAAHDVLVMSESEQRETEREVYVCIYIVYTYTILEASILRVYFVDLKYVLTRGSDLV